MKFDGHGLFTELAPPPGGAERFRRRLDESTDAPRAPRWRVFALAGAACAAVAVAAVVALHGSNDSASLPVADSERTAAIYDAPEFDRLLGRPPQPAELTVMLNEQIAPVAEIETGNEKVRIYRIN